MLRKCDDLLQYSYAIPIIAKAPPNACIAQWITVFVRLLKNIVQTLNGANAKIPVIDKIF